MARNLPLIFGWGKYANLSITIHYLMILMSEYPWKGKNNRVGYFLHIVMAQQLAINSIMPLQLLIANEDISGIYSMAICVTSNNA